MLKWTILGTKDSVGITTLNRTRPTCTSSQRSTLSLASQISSTTTSGMEEDSVVDRNGRQKEWSQETRKCLVRIKSVVVVVVVCLFVCLFICLFVVVVVCLFVCVRYY